MANVGMVSALCVCARGSGGSPRKILDFLDHQRAYLVHSEWKKWQSS